MKLIPLINALLISFHSFGMNSHDMSNLKAKRIKQLYYTPEQKIITAIYCDEDKLMIKEEAYSFNGTYIWICPRTKQETGSIIRLSQQESKELFDLYVAQYLELQTRIKP